MKKNLHLVVVVAILGLFASGCASLAPIGTIYTDISLPSASGAGSGDAQYSKVGMATSNSFLTLIATGDSSIEAAVKNGNITKIKFVDYKAKNILGIFGEYTTYVYGD